METRMEFKLALDGAPPARDVKAVKLGELSDAELAIWEAGQFDQSRKYEARYDARRRARSTGKK